ncbi:MFS transporter [Nocardia sp. NPDC059177]|uniref:MFS transporter n=1 Tax=Nocardia sp. NPDC059177 TaxID=3346759 RepID=UPI0036B493F3
MQFMLVMDDTVVNVALPSIRADLGFDTPGLVWVVNAYFLAFGGLLLLFGRLADLLGRRRVFLTGVALFGLASLLGGIAQEPWQMVAGRFAQGAGAAMAAPAALSLITLMFPAPAERATALSIWGGIAALGATMGLVISGALTDLLSWRWIFLINLPVAAAALILVPGLVAESRADNRPRMDVPGAVLGTAAVFALVYGLLRTGEVGWGDATVLGAMALAMVLVIAFLVVESRATAPLVPAAFLRVRVRAVADGATLVFSAAAYTMAFLLMIQLQTALDYSPLVAGLAYLPYGAGILTGMWLSARVVRWIGMRWAITWSFVAGGVGLALLAGIAPGDDYASGVLPGMLVTSVATGLVLPMLATAAMAGTTERDAGLGSALFTSAQQIGGAVGLALLVSATSDYAGALGAAAGLLVFGAVLVAALFRAEDALAP